MASHKSGGGIGQPLHWSERERRLWILVLFICSILIYAARSSLSVSIVEMASEFDWNKRTCGIILSSFFWGYSATQVIGGQLGDKYGGELVLWTSALVWGGAVLSISIVASISTTLVFVAHLTNGLSQGVYFPAIASLLTTRVSDENRSFVNGADTCWTTTR
ncbi:PREDICTED: solute carrier family 17 member 9-like, partial [Amphimedon queenslandica]|uniref:Major facilitator superfamily (MFS) profile domain-containing protein n=2 Tax=Amphimedon queenslandica TaxID=400682 RepID=A0AAN0JP93_AMPQE